MRKRKLHSWDEVDQALARLGIIEPEVARLQAQMDAMIAGTRERYDREIAPLQREIKALVPAVGDFVMAHRSELSPDGEKRSRQLSHGKVGLYLTPPRLQTIGRTTWKRVLELIFELPLRVHARLVRTTRELDKEGIKEAIETGLLSEEQRCQIRVAIGQDEIAYYELA